MDQPFVLLDARFAFVDALSDSRRLLRVEAESVLFFDKKRLKRPSLTRIVRDLELIDKSRYILLADELA